MVITITGFFHAEKHVLTGLNAIRFHERTLWCTSLSWGRSRFPVTIPSNKDSIHPIGLFIFIYKNIYVCTNTYMCLHVDICINIYIYAYTRKYIYISYVCSCMYIHIYMHTWLLLIYPVHPAVSWVHSEPEAGAEKNSPAFSMTALSGLSRHHCCNAMSAVGVNVLEPPIRGITNQ